ncbi:MAG: hypothetical protein AUJ28_02685 [Parcubacteria group bacterium CG1_02_37_51]|uniref:UPF0235 protein CO073_04015 n=2 Tax=Candidatus Komeiliibacteriota TaxID=1817908 RepID=A0A2M8DQC7_9BACT|nr:MAG: hypothetical protein AUJ28_02685 [Parcubacteria group bacterium CG1_02_37_51]PIY94058.1 MAG: hypothetical protein COY67_03105 [Candidatus Komeilibacteria bacterium CG_4_10_14_0_8_um_filter_37_78]PJC01229.1 MAG: hypothetical protein CO073_04015 [Candidatus Komeilibacteria bacterium CG_4_9_14_0_8_um_filter_36_9]
MPKKIIEIKVIPRSKENKVIEEGDNKLKVKLTAPPVDNKANFALVDILAEHYQVRRGQIAIISGVKDRNKKVQIEL